MKHLRTLLASAVIILTTGCASTSVDTSGPTGELYTSELKFHGGDTQSAWTVNYVVTEIFDSNTMQKVYETSKFLPDFGSWMELPVGEYIVMHRCYYVQRSNNKEYYNSKHEDVINIEEGKRIEFEMPLHSAPRNGCRAVPKVKQS